MGMHGQAVATLQAAGETFGAFAHLAGRAVHVQRQADHQGGGPPLVQQSLDLLPVGHAVLRLEGEQFAGLAGHGLADGDTDLPGAVVEAQVEPAGRAHAWPAWRESRRRSTPSRAAAAPRRCSLGVSNSRALVAGVVSQRLAASSSSSWPGPQPL